MNLNDVLKRQLEDIATFKIARQKAWDDLKENHGYIKNAFGNKESEIPDHIKKQMEKQEAQFNREWGNNGLYNTQMTKRYLIERLKVNQVDTKKFLEDNKKSIITLKDLDRGK